MNTDVAHPPSGPSASLDIAVADDVTEIQELLQEWLTVEGHRVTCLADGRQLEQAYQEGRRFDLVITDVIMPETDGLEVIVTLRKLDPRLRIIAISGGGFAMTASDCLVVAHRLGADAVVRKPFTRQQLLTAVGSVMTAAA